MKSNSLLIINQSQYGYHIDYTQYCRFLKDDFNITYLCWDYKKNRINDSGIKILYISRKGNIIKRNIRFISYALNLLKKQKFSLVFIHYFLGASFLSLLNTNKQQMHLDIRTGNVSPNSMIRNIFNTTLRFESFFFKSNSIISIGLRNLLKINKNAYILPLGANPVFVENKSKHKLHLLYIGILTNRKIEDTILGVSAFLKEFPSADLHYTIVGDGFFDEKDRFQNLVDTLGLQTYIDLTGYVPNNELTRFYEIATAGVSYIPITPYYEYQPATKTFEYLMAGKPVIATRTYENKQVINPLNGILINDTSDSFASAVAQLYSNLDSFDEKTIRKSVENYEWSRIIQTMKINILQ